MLKIFQRPEPDTAPVTVGRVPRGGIVTDVPEFDSIGPIGVERSAPDREACRQMVRQMVALLAERKTLSGSTGAIMDGVIEYWHRQWDVAAHEAYLADQAYVNSLIASQAAEHADRVAAQVAALQHRLADAAGAHAVAHLELTGREVQPEPQSVEPVVLPRLLPREAVATTTGQPREGDPAQPNLIAIEGRSA